MKEIIYYEVSQGLWTDEEMKDYIKNNITVYMKGFNNRTFNVTETLEDVADRKDLKSIIINAIEQNTKTIYL